MCVFYKLNDQKIDYVEGGGGCVGVMDNCSNIAACLGDTDNWSYEGKDVENGADSCWAAVR